MVFQKKPSIEEKKKLSIILVSDTHGESKPFREILQMKGDIFIHAGDFTDYGEEQDFFNFFKILDKLNFKHKIVIAGNHEISLDNGCITNKKKEVYLHKYKCKVKNKIFSSVERILSVSSKRDAFTFNIRPFKSKESPFLDHLIHLIMSEMLFSIENGIKNKFGMLFPKKLTF